MSSKKRDTKNMQAENVPKTPIVDQALETTVTSDEAIPTDVVVDTQSSDETVDVTSTEETETVTQDSPKTETEETAAVAASTEATVSKEETKPIEANVFVTATPTNPPAPVGEEGIAEEFEVILLRDRLATYQKVMSPKVRSDENDRLLQQKALRTAVLAVLALRGSKFTKALDVLLTFFHQNVTGCTGIRYIFREFDRLGLDRATRTSYENLLHLLISAADPSTRRLVSKQVDVPAALAGVRNNEEVYQLLSEFFG